MTDFYHTNYADCCNDLMRITDAEWEYNHDTGGSRLRVTDAEPAKCVFPTWEEYIPAIVMERHGACEREYDPIPF